MKLFIRNNNIQPINTDLTPYANILGVEVNASLQEIKTNYYQKKLSSLSTESEKEQIKPLSIP